MSYWWARWRAQWARLNPKKKTVIGIIGLLILAAAIYVPLYFKYRNLKSTRQSTNEKPGVQFDPNQEATATSKLDGTEAPRSLANRHPLAVIVENHPDARPQFGLSQASIVYEALTEGGITRYLAIYGPREATKVGPVRSARTYFVDWTREYDAFLAHAGGAQNALTKIVQDDIKDLPHNQSAYWREKNDNLALEHTLFTSTTKLYQYAQNQKFDIATSDFQPWLFKKESSANSKAASGSGVMIGFSGNTAYTVEWTYDSQSNSYNRKLANVPHEDALTGEQIKAKNIVLLTMPNSSVESGGKTVYAITTTGSGKATILRDGNAVEGKWQKTKASDRTKIYDNTGQEVQFNPGAIWIEIINPNATNYSVK